MKKFFTWPVTFEKIEFWAATAIYAVMLFDLIMAFTHQDIYYKPPNSYGFTNRALPFSYTWNYFMPSICRYTAYYLAFCFLNFYSIKNIIKKIAVWRNITLSALTIVLLIATMVVIDGLWYKSNLFVVYKPPAFIHQPQLMVYKIILRDNLSLVSGLLLIFIGYTFVKHIIHALIKSYRYGQIIIPAVVTDCLILLALWLLNTALAPHRTKVADFAIPSILYLFAYIILIPYIKHSNKKYWLYSLYSIAVALIALFVLHGMYLYPYRSFTEIVSGLSFTFLVYLMMMHAAWFFYTYRERKRKLKGLQTALGHSSANLDLLRSQINPHFLFNALNTLYGTALQEEAQRTGEGIQKLGDMMRFMLHDNTQQTIPLNREVEYLENYINLQKLRTQASPDIVIQTEIDEHFNDLHIAPMLLIPFVENAFKHGISLREPSIIKITLHTVDSLLYFDVHNSIHTRPDNDPEKYSNGIGLENVRQRLDLLYPERHELTIRETTKEFFIHLTIEL